jgi:hypothetical protein
VEKLIITIIYKNQELCFMQELTEKRKYSTTGKVSEFYSNAAKILSIISLVLVYMVLMLIHTIANS